MNKVIQKIAEECSNSVRIDGLSLFHLRPYMESFFDSNWLERNLIEYKTLAKKYSDPLLQRVRAGAYLISRAGVKCWTGEIEKGCRKC